MPRTIVGREVDEEADERAPGVDEREGRREGRGRGRGWAGRLLGRPTREKRRGEGRVERAAAGRKGRRGGNEPVGLLSISIFFSFPSLHMHCLN